MKPINFITAPSPAAQRSLARMLHFFMAFIVSIIIILGAITAYYTHYLTTLKQDIVLLASHCARFTSRLQEQEQLTAQEQELQSKLRTATTLLKKQHNPQTLIQTVQRAKPATISLQTLSIHQHEITCTLHCADPRNAHTYLQNLIKTRLFSTARITEIRSHGHVYQTTIQLTYI